ncbi:DUF554 domain-containing protein [Thermospira aquatica]|uniref:DUF554 domain-containing protein n=1 Tax=Thermospira aquatica TaxID=2828656 RepID=A0AAX3BD16_9SPIR|nr:DUF554 domain-containing protein [Thermospira aquatica]URA10065.1 DUF554 domain-containing protein [Thermospira aquatica]
MIIGSMVNAATVFAGSLVGIFLKRFVSDKYEEIAFQGLGLSTIMLSLSMMLSIKNPLPVIFSVVLGGLVGEWLQLENRFLILGEKLRERLPGMRSNFAEGVVSASVLFCVGAMTITGCLQEGVTGDFSILLTKALLDGFASIVLATTWGWGVFAAGFVVLIFQGGLTLLARWIGPWMSDFLIAQLVGTGGILVLGIGMKLLGIKPVRTLSLLPSLLFIVIFSLVFPH